MAFGGLAAGSGKDLTQKAERSDTEITETCSRSEPFSAVKAVALSKLTVKHAAALQKLPLRHAKFRNKWARLYVSKVRWLLTHGDYVRPKWVVRSGPIVVLRAINLG
jgi:hypothetical protein